MRTLAIYGGRFQPAHLGHMSSYEYLVDKFGADNGFEGAEEGPDGLQEVSKTGTGFMLIKRHVFEKLNAHPAVKPFNSDIGLPPELNIHMKTYFDTAVRENRYYSEDWTFSENWRDLGGRIWVDKRVLLKHTGTYVFDYQNHQ